MSIKRLYSGEEFFVVAQRDQDLRVVSNSLLQY
jgi:hypothetical protein